MKMATASASMDGGEFRQAVKDLILEREPIRVIETGTYHGTGSTRALIDGLEAAGGDYTLLTIEVNPGHHGIAQMNLAGYSRVQLLNGLSIPRRLLPSDLDTRTMIESLRSSDVYVDHGEAERLQLYRGEVSFDVPDDLLGKAMASFSGAPDLLLLDSAGHLGFIEFNYALSLLRSPCLIVLDDTRHIKHYKSLQLMKRDPRFEILKESDERFGFCIAEYTGGKDEE